MKPCDEMVAKQDVLILCAQVFYSFLVPAMGIASTLIIVRVVLGIAIKDEESFRATVLQDYGTATTPQWTLSSIIGMHSQCDTNSVEGTEDPEEGPNALESLAKVESDSKRVPSMNSRD
ncbi:hypothetical protein V5O48_007069 [Marasmius crinis-equi]|uniref:Uncharacterized protein n=1 Tax=Marasmius crinis-equi TaxID=585013 RepID=A0ABR3FI63_9AGAR